MASILVTQATSRDVEHIVELWEEFINAHVEQDELFTPSDTAQLSFSKFVSEHIDSDESVVVVARSGEQVVGYCLAKKSEYPPVLANRYFCEIFDVCVTKSFRRMGIGENLFSYVENWCRSKEISRIEVRILLKNDGGLGYWIKMGLQPYLMTAYKEL